MAKYWILSDILLTVAQLAVALPDRVSVFLPKQDTPPPILEVRKISQSVELTSDVAARNVGFIDRISPRVRNQLSSVVAVG